MMTTPSISASAQSLFTDGFNRLNSAATSFASLSNSPATVLSSNDPVLSGVTDLFTARQEVGAGSVLLETDEKLLDMLTDSLGHHLDRYA